MEHMDNESPTIKYKVEIGVLYYLHTSIRKEEEIEKRGVGWK